MSWIVRLVLAVLTLEAGICAAFLVENWQVLRRAEDSLFAAALSLARPKQRFVLDPIPPSERERHVRPLEAGRIQNYFQVPVTDSLPASSPLIPEDWEILLRHMHEVGCRIVAVEPPLTWEGDDITHLLGLGSFNWALSLYDTAVLTVDLQRVTNPHPLPDYLRPSAIPLKNVRGEVGALVRVNRVIHPPSASAAPNVRFSFRVQESVEDVVPAFVRWDDFLIPSFPLAVAMAQNNVTPEEVTIEVGRHIRLGDGPLVAINEIGELQIEWVEGVRNPQASAEDVVLASEIPSIRAKAGETVPRCALFVDASPDNPAPWSKPHRLQRLVNSFDVLPRPGAIERHDRLPLWAELLLLAVIAAVASLLVSCRGLFRILGFLLHFALLAALLGALFLDSHRWTLLLPLVVATLTGLLLSFRMARHLPPPSLATQA